MLEDVVLVGGFLETIELCYLAEKRIIGIIDNTHEDQLYDIPVLGKDADAAILKYCIGNAKLILAPDQPSIRKKLFNLYSSIGYSFANLISPRSNISPAAKVGNGVVIQSYVNISSNVKVGDFVKLNTCSNIMHDSSIGSFSTIAPNAVVLGYVTIEEMCYIGANSTILPKMTIRHNTTIGAGCVVTKNHPADSIIKGVPGRSKRKDTNEQ